MVETIQKETVSTKAAAGMVRIQAQTMRPATHFTADNLRVAPTPSIEPVIVCVVETGRAVSVTYASVNAAVGSAQKPADWFQFCDLCAHRMRNAPAFNPGLTQWRRAPRARPWSELVARFHRGYSPCPNAAGGEHGRDDSHCLGASLRRWPNEKAAAEKSWPRLKILSTRGAEKRRKIQ